MSYIGNSPTSIAFLTDLFTGTGSLTTFTMSAAPASTSSILVSITGIVQEPSTYAVSGNTLTFSQAPPAGTGNVSVRYLGIPASNIVSTAYRTVTDFTATLAQTIFTVPSYTVGYITVYRNGARLGAADYTASSGTNVILTVAANTGDLVTTESFYVSSVLNAIPAVAGAVTSSYIIPNVSLSSPSYTGTLTGSTGILNIGSGQLYKDASGNVGIGTSSPTCLLDVGGTGAIKLPAGTTAQRPVSPVAGMIRYNTTESKYECYTGSAWQFLSTSGYPYTVSYLVVAGGGGGGNVAVNYGGGGGAGGLLTSTASLTPGAVCTITVGAGGAQAASGSNSVLSGTGITTVTCVGGGKGGGNDANGSSGGSGGGAGGNDAATTGGAATSGQGFVGGNHAAASATGGGGGGGTSSAGGNAEVTTGGGTGGAGLASSISGSSVTYSSGGGGQKGFYGLVTDGVNGTGWSNTANRGHGGAPTTQRAGSSGVVILSVPTTNYTGTTTGSPTVTTSGSNTIITFTASGSYTA